MRKQMVILITVGILAIVGFAIYAALPQIFGSVVVPLHFPELVTEKAKKYGVDSCLIEAFMQGESRGNPNAKSRVGASGLMQLMPGTAAAMAARTGQSYSASKIFDPDLNVDLGTALIAYNIKNYGSLRNISVAYNAGGGRVGRADSQLPRETQGYIRKMEQLYSLYYSVHGEFCTGPKLGSGGSGLAVPQNTGPDFPDFQTVPEATPNLNIDSFWKFLINQ